MKDLLIVGHGGLGRECAFIIDAINRVEKKWNVLGFVGQTPASIGTPAGRLKVVRDDSWLDSVDYDLCLVLAVGNLKLLRSLHRRFSRNSHLTFPAIVHPSSTGDWERVQLGQGTIVFNDVAFTTDIRVGDFNIINPGCTISHDCVLADYNLLGPGAHLAGGVVVGSGILVGAGAKLLPEVSITDNVTIGGGAVVCRSIATEGTYAGVPAHPLPGRRTE